MTFLIHSIGEGEHSNLNTIEEAQGKKLTADGVYKSIYENREKLRGTILFIMGDYVGTDNSFDEGKHYLEEFCTWQELYDLRDNYNCELAWHTKSHRDLTKLSQEELEEEIKPRVPMDKFAYPYGKFNDDVIKVVKKYFKEAYSVTDGDDSQYQRLRKYV